MTLKTKAGAIIISLLVAFSFGRYSVNQTPDVKTTENIKTNNKINENKNNHTKTTVVTTKDKDGVEKTITTVDSVTNDQLSQTDKSSTDIKQSVTPPKQSKANISLIAANDFAKGQILPSYGLSVSKEIIGPITIGAFGLNNGTIGVSIGLDF